MQEPAEAPLTEQTAWRYLNVFLQDFAKLWGQPIALARSIDLPRREYEVCASWLRALEAWLRRLLLIAASRIAVRPQREAKKRPSRKCPAASASFASDDSADWRVSLKLNPPTHATHGRRGKSRGRLAWNPVPLAARFEALLRVARNPERHVVRAARALAKNATLPNRLFAQKLKNMSALRPYVAQCSLLLLEPFPEAWRAADTS